MSVIVTPKQALTIVRASLLGKHDQFAADATGLSVRLVRQVAEQYGAPDKTKLEWARDELEEKAAAAPARPATPRPGPVAVPEPERAGGVNEVLDLGRKSNKARTRQLTERIQGMLDDLQHRLAGETQEAEEKRRREAEKEKARAEVERLEKELAEAKARAAGRAPGKPKRKPATPTAVDYDTRKVREWALANGVECPKQGRFLPRAVVDAWREAQQRGAA